jgi:hypothetical protein
VSLHRDRDIRPRTGVERLCFYAALFLRGDESFDALGQTFLTKTRNKRFRGPIIIDEDKRRLACDTKLEPDLGVFIGDVFEAEDAVFIDEGLHVFDVASTTDTDDVHLRAKLFLHFCDRRSLPCAA